MVVTKKKVISWYELINENIPKQKQNPKTESVNEIFF